MLSTKRRTYNRRRTRSVGSEPFSWPSTRVHLQWNQTQTDDVGSSSTSKDQDNSAYAQSDSDDNESVFSNMEPGIFSGRFPCFRSAKRKRKLKKIAMEFGIPASSRYCSYINGTQSHSKRRKSMRHSLQFPENRLWYNYGKRRKYAKDRLRRTVDDESSDFGKDSKVLAISKLSLDDFEQVASTSVNLPYTKRGFSSSDISSSGSETEIFTNDEGREGDDEQSDWIGDVTGATSNFHDQSSCKYLLNLFDTCNDKRFLRSQIEKIKDVDYRLLRRKNRSMKPSFALVIPPEARCSDMSYGATLEDEEPSSMSKMDVLVERCMLTRRHTFSGFKKKKRVPTAATASNDTMSDKSSELFSAVHRLSDISSSDSKDSLM